MSKAHHRDDEPTMGEVFKAMKDSSQIRRAFNREASADMLKRLGISFQSKNNGAHLIVAERWECWPGTGKWKHLDLPIAGRGIVKLIAAIESLAHNQGAKTTGS